MSRTFNDLTQFERAGERFNLFFDEQSVIWSVNGGYLAAAMLRIAGDVSSNDKPVSINCQFLRSVKQGAAHATCDVILTTSIAELLRVQIYQDEGLKAYADIWTMSPRPGPAHQDARMPKVPHPRELRPLEELRPPDAPPRPRFFEVFDERMIDRSDLQNRLHKSAHLLLWIRYREMPSFDCVFLGAARSLPIIDIWGIPATTQIFENPSLTTLAPTIQFTAHFYNTIDLGEWILCDAYGEFAGDGLISTRVKTWSISGELIAQGFSQMVTKPGKGFLVEPEQSD